MIDDTKQAHCWPCQLSFETALELVEHVRSHPNPRAHEVDPVDFPEGSDTERSNQ